MKIVSSKPESQNPIVNSDSANSSTQTVPDNLFLSLIMQAMTPMKLPVNPETPPTTSDLGEFTATGDAPAGYDTQLFLAQLDKMNLQPQETVPNPENITKPALENNPAAQDILDQASAGPAISKEINKELDKEQVTQQLQQASTKVAKDIKNNLDKEPITQQPIAQQPIEQPGINQSSPLMTEEVVSQMPKPLPPKDTKKESDLKNLTPTSTAASLTNDDKDRLLAERVIKQKLPEATEIKQSKATDNQAIFGTSDVTNSTTLFSIPLDQSYTPPPQENKYSDALLQLGQLINAQTMNTFSKNDQSIAINASTISPELDLAAKHLPAPDFNLQIELSPPTIDALNKETYDAKIKIYPPELGEVMAKLRVDKNGTELFITTENNRVKEIVEANLPQLRESFQQADINLTEIQVQTSSSGTKEQRSDNWQQGEHFTAKESSLESNSEQVVSPKESPKKSDKLVDTYA